MSRIPLYLPIALIVILGSNGIAIASVSDSADSQLKEVVVTAQRRSQNLKDVPLAVTVLNTSNLVVSNAVRLEDYAQSVPGLTYYGDGFGTGLLAIRGIVTGQGTTPLVGIYLDDTPIGSTTVLGSGDNPMVPDIDPSDLERIEVLKGPQGTLFGANSMGGVVRFVTMAPDPTQFGGRVELDGSSVSRGGSGYGLRGSVNLPLISDRLALSINAVRRRDPGYIDNVAPGGHSNVNLSTLDNIVVALLWRVTRSIDVRLNVLYQELKADGAPIEDYDFFNLHAPVYGNLRQYRVPNNDQDLGRLQIYNAAIHWDLGPAVLTSSSSYGETPYNRREDLTSLFGPLFGEILGNPNLGIDDVLYNHTKKFTQELRLAGNPDSRQAAGGFDWIVGLYYDHENSISDESLQPTTLDGAFVTGLPLLIDSVGLSTYREAAAFGDVTYYLTGRASVQAGVRYSDTREQALQISPASVLGGSAASIPGKASGKVTTFLFSPQFKLTNDATLYSRIASGYRPGGPNFFIPIPGAYAPSEFQPDKLVDYEIGQKSYLFDRKLYVEANAFYIDWKDIQLEGENAQDLSFVTNAGSATSRGAEIDGKYRPVDEVTLAVDLAYTDAHLTADAPSVIYGPSGSRLPFSPRLSAELSGEYTQSLGSRWTGSLGADMSYTGSRLSDFTPSVSVPRVSLASYYLMNLHLSVSNGAYTVGLFARNLFDARGFLSVTAQTLDMLHEYDVMVTQPRTVGVSLAADF